MSQSAALSLDADGVAEQEVRRGSVVVGLLPGHALRVVFLAPDSGLFPGWSRPHPGRSSRSRGPPCASRCGRPLRKPHEKVDVPGLTCDPVNVV
jgi:hypothetical protein